MLKKFRVRGFLFFLEGQYYIHCYVARIRNHQYLLCIVVMGPPAASTGLVGGQIKAETALSLPLSDFIFYCCGVGVCPHRRIIQSARLPGTTQA